MGLNAVDRWFLAIDGPGVSSAVAVMATFSPPADAPPDYVHSLAERMRADHEIVAPFNRRLRRVSTRRLAPAFETLAPEQIDLDYHFRHLALPGPAGQRELGSLIQRIFSAPLDYTRPLWELSLIEGLEGGRFVWFFKVHHSLMDGVGAVARFRAMLDTDPTADRVTPFWAIAPARGSRPPGQSIARLSLPERVRNTTAASRALARATAADVREAVNPQDASWATAYTAPETRLNSRVSSHRRFATRTFDLDRLVGVSKGFGVTVNDVFLAICSGSLRRYLDDLGELPGESLVAGCPVSVRTEDDSSNAISSVLCKLRTDIDDPAERIRAIAESTAGAKGRLKALPRQAANMMGVVGLTPLAVQQLVGLSGRTRAPFNLLISNVTGPKESLFLAGAHLESLHPLSIVSHGQALNMSGGSFSGKFHLGVIGCPDVLPHLQRLALYAEDALEELEKACETSVTT